MKKHAVSENVRRAREAGYSSAGHFAAVGTMRFFHRGGAYENTRIFAGNRQVEVYVSPTGRSVRVYVDGNEIREES